MASILNVDFIDVKHWSLVKARENLSRRDTQKKWYFESDFRVITFPIMNKVWSYTLGDTVALGKVVFAPIETKPSIWHVWNGHLK